MPDSDVAGAALDPQRVRHVRPQSHVAGAGLDRAGPVTWSTVDGRRSRSYAGSCRSSRRPGGRRCRSRLARSLPVGTVDRRPAGRSRRRRSRLAARGDDADLAAGLLDDDLVGVAAGDLDGGLGGLGRRSRGPRPCSISTYRSTGSWVSKWCWVMTVSRVCSVHGAGLVRRSAEWGGWWWCAGQTQPVMRLLPRALPAERVVPAEERDAREVDVDVDGVLAGRGPDHVDQPGVERVPGAGRQLLGPGLDRLGDAQRDPGQAALLLDLLRASGERAAAAGRARSGRRRRRSRARGR